MKGLGHLFSSAARTEVLRALYYQPDEVGLRQLARIAGIHVRSAELAVNGLVRERLVTRRREPSRVFYAMNRDHSSAPVLAAVFDAAAIATIRMDSSVLDNRAKRILPFIREANRMLTHARSSRHDA